MAGSPTTTALERADAALEAGKTVEAEKLYQEVLSTSSASNANTTDASIQQQQLRDQEKANAAALSRTLSLSRSFMSSTSTAKAKTAKLIRTLLDFFGAIEGSEEVLKATLQENIEWARKEKRVFLKHSLETRLVGLYLDTQQYRPALALIDTLLTELKRLDDKMILTEVHLLESRVYRGVGNYAKAKAALTSSRTAANSIYCPPILQAQLDLQSGVLHAEDKDYTTAYSYFFEAFENFSAQGDDTAALGALKYMLLCKVMLNLPDDVNNLLTIKLATKYANVRDVESMRAIARAHQDRNLGEFERVLREFRGAVSPVLLEIGFRRMLSRFWVADVFPHSLALRATDDFIFVRTIDSRGLAFLFLHSFAFAFLVMFLEIGAPPLRPMFVGLMTSGVLSARRRASSLKRRRLLMERMVRCRRGWSEARRRMARWKGKELSSDPTIRSHLASLYDNLLEQNLLRIIEPYSTVEIEYVAELVGQERQGVEAKLSQMILDKVFHGVLDQGRGCLLVFDEPEVDNAYGAAIETLEEVGKVVQSLYAKSVQIA
ncbi:hypothetical protein NMY22_g9039 [Coprinellus aureogranulatus]|nr:hypothetical protein NMY22_g9039 [Coprinellus aureogranulatus]